MQKDVTHPMHLGISANKAVLLWRMRERKVKGKKKKEQERDKGRIRISREQTKLSDGIPFEVEVRQCGAGDSKFHLFLRRARLSSTCPHHFSEEAVSRHCRHSPVGEVLSAHLIE